MTELTERWKMNVKEAVKILDSLFVPTSGIRQIRRDKNLGLDVSEDVLGIYTLEVLRMSVYVLIACDAYTIFNR